jgi:hypothetical protein
MIQEIEPASSPGRFTVGMQQRWYSADEPAASRRNLGLTEASLNSYLPSLFQNR